MSKNRVQISKFWIFPDMHLNCFKIASEVLCIWLQKQNYFLSFLSEFFLMIQLWCCMCFIMVLPVFYLPQTKTLTLRTFSTDSTHEYGDWMTFLRQIYLYWQGKKTSIFSLSFPKNHAEIFSKKQQQYVSSCGKEKTAIRSLFLFSNGMEPVLTKSTKILTIWF